MPNFSYETDIPFENNDPSVDQPDMKTNTNSIDSILQVDLYGFNNPNGGWHQKSTYVNQNTIPPSQVGQVVIYNKNSELWMVRDGDNATNCPLTSNKIGIPLGGVNGYSYLPGSILVQWFIVNAPVANTNILFPLPFPNACFNIQLTPIVSDNSTIRCYVSSGTVTTSGFQIKSTSSSNFTGMYVYAIGG